MRFEVLPAAFLLAALASGQIITDFAGDGIAGYSGDNGPATQAEVKRVVGLASDASGNIYLADQNNNVVRKVDPSGTITTFAGTGAQGFSGDSGPATQALLNQPSGVCVAPSGVIYVNDQFNHRVRAISTSGIITTVAGSGSTLSFGDGGPATSAGLDNPIRCAVDQSGNLYIVDQGAHDIRKVNTSGVITTFAGVANSPGFSGDNGPAVAALMNNPTAASFDAAGNLYVTDQVNHRIRKIDTSATITTVAGNGVNAFAGDHLAATSASLNFPGETAIDAAGNLFIVDSGNEVIRMVSGGIITTVAGTPATPGNNGDGGPPSQAQFNNPFALVLDPAANLYVGDITNNRVRKITGLATASTPCTYTLSSGGQAFPASGGTGSIAITTGIGCPWSMSGAPLWIAGPTSGSGNGTLTYQVVQNVGTDRSITVTVAGLLFSIEQEGGSITGLSFIGSMPHIAAEENWTTLFTLVNKTPSSTEARLSFFGDALDPTGNGPLALPLAFPQQVGSTGPLLASSFDRPLPANASLIVTSAGAQVSPVLIGSAQLSATGAVDGFAIFHLIPGAQEAVVPMETRNARSYLLAFDNTNSVVLGIAIDNVSSQRRRHPRRDSRRNRQRDRQSFHHFASRQRPHLVCTLHPIPGDRRQTRHHRIRYARQRTHQRSRHPHHAARNHQHPHHHSRARQRRNHRRIDRPHSHRQRLADHLRAGEHRHYHGASNPEFLLRCHRSPAIVAPVLPADQQQHHDGKLHGEPTARPRSNPTSAKRRARFRSHAHHRLRPTHHQR